MSVHVRIRSGTARWLPQNLRAFACEIDYNLAALPDRPLRRTAIRGAEERRFGYTREIPGSR